MRIPERYLVGSHSCCQIETPVDRRLRADNPQEGVFRLPCAFCQYPTTGLPALPHPVRCGQRRRDAEPATGKNRDHATPTPRGPPYVTPRRLLPYRTGIAKKGRPLQACSRPPIPSAWPTRGHLFSTSPLPATGPEPGTRQQPLPPGENRRHHPRFDRTPDTARPVSAPYATNG